MHELALRVNGAATSVAIQPQARLLDVLREQLGLTGTKEGCGNGECGACTVLVDGRAINACLYPAIEAHGREVTTIEGLRAADGLSTLQQAFVDNGGIQCGFCSPGMIMAAKGLLDANPSPTDQEICEALAGNLCRCTGYVPIIAAVRAAAKALDDQQSAEREVRHG